MRENDRKENQGETSTAREEHNGPASHEEKKTSDPKAGENRANSEKAKAPWYRRPLLVGFLMIAVIGGVVAGVLLWLHSRHYQTTDDAFIDVVPEHVSPQVAGRILRVLVDDNQDVKSGDALVEIDPSDYQVRVKQGLAGKTQAEAQVAQAKAQQTVIEAQLKQAKADLLVTEANATNAVSLFGRYKDLHGENAGAVSQQQLDNASAAARSSEAQVMSAKEKVGAAEAQFQYAARQIESAQAGVASAEAQLEQAKINLSYTTVKASLAGRISSRTATSGNYAQPGTELMAVVPKEVYVTANFKETQLARMRRNQPVEVHVDSYPDLILHGHIDSVQPASGQVFSLLPPQNASGNWVKIVQRIPVKIVFDNFADDPERRLAPGMSVKVKAKVR